MPNNPTVPHPAEALILARIPAPVRERAARVRLMVFDVDGTLTDGSLWYGEHGEALKRFHVLDGQGLRMLAAGGVTVGILTARDGPIVTRRAADLGIAHVVQGVHDKAGALAALAQRCGLTFEEAGYMGDDINDLPAMRQAAFAATVPGAPSYVAQAAHWCAQRGGGAGAARECCDLILAAQGRLSNVLTGTPQPILPGASPQ
ncbi:phenylphosphate carboxylase subunit delta [Verticiella sediminum]|uniref:3-deoxy-D-manno-octulosonate 8-phosphate phosphatase KdsC n=1 Tax=Verticiella sediminum TaxID=1247510 RepID=A0A556AB67_9BURK|nr:phenylphosphate carboxylase subunit delta [Verticiella sediminum]TSH90136.1 phenylphosphate carboxylase subunit delta [Verticiella sediminum]